MVTALWRSMAKAKVDQVYLPLAQTGGGGGSSPSPSEPASSRGASPAPDSIDLRLSYDGEGEKHRRSFHDDGDSPAEYDDDRGDGASPCSDAPLLPGPRAAQSPSAAATKRRRSTGEGALGWLRQRVAHPRVVLAGAAGTVTLLALVGATISSNGDRRSPLSIWSSSRSSVDLASPRPQFEPLCAPREWSNGTWHPLAEPFPANITVWDASPDFHGHGCAQNWFRADWYLGVIPPGAEGEGPENQLRPDGEWPMSGYRRRAAGYRYEAGSETCTEQVDAPWKAMRDYEGGREDEGTIRLLQDLVDRGGWLIVGDSLSEGHFYSLSCLLFPHVRALWPYPTMSEWRQIKEEHLFLDRESPLIKTGQVVVPEDWDWDGAPVVSHVRSDHGLAPVELVELFDDFKAGVISSDDRNLSALYPALAAPQIVNSSTSLLTPIETFSTTLDYIMELFLRPAGYRNITTGISPSYAESTTPPEALAIEERATRSARYRALIFSTGAHFSDRHFQLPNPAAHIEYFQLTMDAILQRMHGALANATEAERSGKEILIRPTTNGHDDCHAAPGPLERYDRSKSSWWSWTDMWTMNDRAEIMVRDFASPQISWMHVNRPAALRPDAHTNDDCLHLAMGTGVVEGWTRYIAYWLREKAAHDDQEAREASRWRFAWPWRD